MEILFQGDQFLQDQAGLRTDVQFVPFQNNEAVNDMRELTDIITVYISGIAGIISDNGQRLAAGCLLRKRCRNEKEGGKYREQREPLKLVAKTLCHLLFDMFTRLAHHPLRTQIL